MDAIDSPIALGDDFAAGRVEAARTAVAPRQTFPCGQCAGSGKWTSPSGRMTGPCRACKGAGHFLTAPRDRAKARTNAVARKASLVDELKIEFARDNMDVLDELHRGYQTSDFCRSLLDQFRAKGTLSVNQIAAVRRGAEQRKVRDEATKARQTEMDLSRIRTLFETAVGAMLKKPTFRAAGLVISLASATSSNPGALYIKVEGGDYVGKVLGTVYMPTRNAGPEIFEGLRDIATDPLAAAIKYGRLSGRCGCCGRLLINDKVKASDGLTSVERGIGPICAAKWGLL